MENRWNSADLFGLKIAQHAVELLLLILTQQLQDTVLTGGADIVHLRLQGLIVHYEIVEDCLDLGGLFLGKIQFLPEPLERDFLAAFLPEGPLLMPLRGHAEASANGASD